MYGADPVQRLRVLGQRVEALGGAAFHEEMATVLTELRDAHTRFVGSRELAGKVAKLPFMVEQVGSTEAPRFLVSNVEKGDPVFRTPGFGKGTELLYWNAKPMALAVKRYADLETGGRADARLARALQTLTFRPLQYGPPPDEHWVVIGFRGKRGKVEEVRVDWRVIDVGQGPSGEAAALGASALLAADPAADAIRRAKRVLFAGATTPIRSRQARKARKAGEGPWIAGELRENVQAKVVATSAGDYGYLRLWSFDLVDDGAFLDEVIDLLDQLPREGLIVDLRGNPGGLIWAAERLLQLFTPRRIEPTRFCMLATELTRAMTEAPQNELSLGPWRRSLRDAVANGEPYSCGVALTPEELCNDIGQKYGGPVVALVDANTYSAGDLFAAGFVDNQVGTLISVGQATGAGGANVWYPGNLAQALRGTPYDLPSLPDGMGYSISFRRALRTGPSAGQPIEDVGVPGHLRRDLTEGDLLEGNRDLLDYCGKLLACETVSDLVVEKVPRQAKLRITPKGLDRIDIYVDDHPFGSLPVDGSEPLEIPCAPGSRSLAVEGYSGETLRQRRVVGP
jgi:hypothetical protein